MQGLSNVARAHTALKKDKHWEAKFIDDAVSFWNNTFQNKLDKIMTKINLEWSKK